MCRQCDTVPRQTLLVYWLQYVYNCVEGSAASSKIYMFAYDNGVLIDVSLTASGTFAGQTPPACIASCTIRN